MRKHCINNNAIWLVLLLSLVSLLGCGHFLKPKVTSTEDAAKKIDRLTLNRGYEMFLNDDIAKAAAVFKSLTKSGDRDISGNARFAFMCSLLILAESTEAVSAADTEMASLLKSGTLKLDNHNLKILNRLLEHQKQQLMTAKGKRPDMDERCAYQYRESLKLKEEKIEGLYKLNVQLKKEISSLKGKIKSIEEIDQKIQEKKNPDQRRKKF